MTLRTPDTFKLWADKVTPLNKYIAQKSVKLMDGIRINVSRFLYVFYQPLVLTDFYPSVMLAHC